MPKLKPDTQRARREHILDAAERCFARNGFHRTTMQNISKEASVSSGSIYVYFKSKEDLIEGLCDRDRKMLSDNLERLVDAPDLMIALQKLGEHYTIEQPRYKQVLQIEIGAESTRNDEVGRLYRCVDQFCLASFESIFSRARAEGKITPDIDTRTIAEIVALIGDGMFWRRAVDPDFDPKPLLPILTRMISDLINPIPPEPPVPANNASAASARHSTTGSDKGLATAGSDKGPAGNNASADLQAQSAAASHRGVTPS